uniref:DDE Tnp4 domain-containing protein n=1 Tax=Timema monikensis TaxID=170555 RepID=A0A7R9HVX6_9NEOP|nr:unnamed protein product [Timema monikensis]
MSRKSNFNLSRSSSRARAAKIARSQESSVHVELRRQEQAERQAALRADETPSQSQERLEDQATRQASMRAAEKPLQTQLRLEGQAECQRALRATETLLQRRSIQVQSFPCCIPLAPSLEPRGSTLCLEPSSPGHVRPPILGQPYLWAGGEVFQSGAGQLQHDHQGHRRLRRSWPSLPPNKGRRSEPFRRRRQVTSESNLGSRDPPPSRVRLGGEARPRGMPAKRPSSTAVRGSPSGTVRVPVRRLHRSAALRFYACGGYQSTVGQDSTVAIAQSSISRAIDEVTRAINDHLFNRWVKLDLHPASLATLRQGFDMENNFPGVIGAIDCTHVAIVAPPIDDPVCDAYMKILNVNARYPGATHDSFIFANSNLRRALQEVHRRNNNGSMWLLGDSGYPLEPWLLTPIEGNIVPNSKEENFNLAHRKTRNIIERCNGLLKSRFRCLLKHRTLHYMPEKASKIITACTVLHNMCIAREVPHYEDVNIPTEDNGMNIWNGEENVNQQPNRNHILAEGRRSLWKANCSSANFNCRSCSLENLSDASNEADLSIRARFGCPENEIFDQ